MKCLYFIYFVAVLALTNLTNAKFIYSCKEKKTIALTFDDGPHKYTKQLVDYLVDEQKVKATFFQLAKFHYPFAIDVEEYQNAMKKAHDNGLQLASHTYGHKIPEDKAEFKKVLTDMDDFIESVTGDRPHYFRAPKGHCDKECQAALDEWGYRLIQWDVDTKDWDLETSGSPEQRIKDSIEILKKKFAEEKDNYLILMHDTEEHTVNSIAPWIIEHSGMREKGYRFVTVAECLGEKEYMYVSGKNYGDDSSATVPPSTYRAGNETVTDSAPSNLISNTNNPEISSDTISSVVDITTNQPNPNPNQTQVTNTTPAAVPATTATPVNEGVPQNLSSGSVSIPSQGLLSLISIGLVTLLLLSM